MMRLLAQAKQRARRWARDEDGSSTLETVLYFPAFFAFFIMAYEVGMLSTRHVMLERGLDQTVREVRIGRILEPTHDMLKNRICNYAAIIPDCANNLRLEMINNNPRSWTDPSKTVQCVDREEEAPPVITFNPALNNELMILRACALFDPMVPLGLIGSTIPKESGDAYGLVATSSYVMEPFQ